MAYKMTKRGSMDNEVTNEFLCETTDDLELIPKNLINLGTAAIVLKPALQLFFADSNKEWISMTPLSGGEE